MPLIGMPILSTIEATTLGPAMSRIAFSTRSADRPVSSMRSPVGPRTCSLICVAFDCREEILAEERRLAAAKPAKIRRKPMTKRQRKAIAAASARRRLAQRARNLCSKPCWNRPKMDFGGASGIVGVAARADNWPWSEPACATADRSRSARRPPPWPSAGTESRKRRPALNIGTNTMQMHNSDTVAGTTIWRAPSMIAASISFFCSSW